MRDDNLLYNGQKNCIWRAIKNFNYYFKTLNVMLRTSMHKNRLVFYVPCSRTETFVVVPREILVCFSSSKLRLNFLVSFPKLSQIFPPTET